MLPLPPRGVGMTRKYESFKSPVFQKTKDKIRELLPGEENKRIRNLMYIFIHTNLTNAKEFETLNKETLELVQQTWEDEIFEKKLDRVVSTS